jgi:hypothetical protein
VALLAPFLVFLWRESGGVKGFLLRSALLGPPACWGILGYMAYLGSAFGDPLAFVKVQNEWAMRPPVPASEHLIGLLVLRPIWSVYVPSSPAFWANFEPTADPLFSLQFANPIWFCASAGLIAIGVRRGWLNAYESAVSAALLAIPYVTHAERAVMMAQGRYAASAFPIYLVLGHLAARCPAPLVAVVAAASGFLLGGYAALFAAWYQII